MGHPQRTGTMVAAVVALLLAPAWGRGDSAPPEGAHPAAKAGARPAHALVQVASPPFSDGIFPCSSCHADLEKNGTRRELAFHDEQQSIFDHGADQRWCLDCHDLANRDVLRLASGEPVPFTVGARAGSVEKRRGTTQPEADPARAARDWIV